MKEVVLALFVCIEVCRSTNITPGLNDEWQQYKIKYQKSYSNTIEELKRRLTWEENLRYIKEHNIKAAKGASSYWLGINQLSDLTIDEVIQHRTGIIIPAPTTYKTFIPQNIDSVPEFVDWRDNGYVTPVKDQGINCGSCWAFSATGAIEGQNMAVNGILDAFSEQDLVDCSVGNSGCDGGWPSQAFEDIIHKGGIDKESTYPYEAQEGTCRFSRDNIGASISGYRHTFPENEDSLKRAVASTGPVSVVITVTNNFSFYKGGVLDDPDCTNVTDVNHAVLVVGYGAYKGGDFWIVKNSWGTDWGINGYIKMSRNKFNQCSIASYGVMPIVDRAGTTSSGKKHTEF